jgi:dipeptidyl aminopeptidase/acylaminoacyl peptidase
MLVNVMKTRISIALVAFVFCWLVGIAIPLRAQEKAASSVAESIKNLDQLKTVAEASGYQATAIDKEVKDYIQSLEKLSEGKIEVSTMGYTREHRAITAIHWNAKDPQETKDRLVVLLLGGIHSGECDGKEALLALARDILKKPSDLWQRNLSLIFVPSYNIDGGERLGKNHRPGQEGPEDGSGIRENSQGLDLNRDFVKLESTEAQSLIRYIDQWDVDVLIDCHTTNGSLHRYEVTYSTPNNPAGPQKLQDYLRVEMMPAMTVQMKKSGYNSFWYGNFADQHKQWQSYGNEPRYSTEYMGLRGRIGILVESYSYASYKTRIDGSYEFVRHCLDYLAANRSKIQDLIAEGEAQWVDKNEKKFQIPSQEKLSIQSKLGRWDEKVDVLGYEVVGQDPAKSESIDELAYFHRGENLDKLKERVYNVELWTKIESTQEVDVPVAYALSKEHAWVADRLLRHGVEVRQLKQPLRVGVDNYRISEVTEEANFQEHRLWKIAIQPEGAKEVDLEAGSYVIPTSQKLGRLLTYILEPHSDDSLAKWNFFDPLIVKNQEYPVHRITKVLSAITGGELSESLETIPASESLTFDKIFSSDRRVTWVASNSVMPRWLPKSDSPETVEYVLRRDNGLLAVDARTGSSRRLDLIERANAAIAKLDGSEARASRGAIGLESFDDRLRFAMANLRRDLYFYDAQTDQARRITQTPDKSEELAELSPDGKRIAFVQDNNLFVVDTETTEAKAITKDNQEDLLNGILDWVYQEEIYGRGNFKAFWWSPDGKKIAFLQLNEKPVDRFPVDDSISYRAAIEETRYPKAGAELPGVKLFTVNVADLKVTEVDLSSYPEKDRLVVRVGWRPDSSHLIFQVQNRIQTWLDICEANPESGQLKQLMREESKAWVDVIEEPRWIASGDFFWLSDQAEGHRHVYRISADGKKREAITEGSWDVSSILWVAEDGSSLIFQGNKDAPIQSHAYLVTTADKKISRLTSEGGTHRVDVDPTGRFMMDRHSSIDSPSRLDLLDAKGTLVRTLSSTTIDRYRFLNVQKPVLTTIQARDGKPLQAMVIAPAGVDLNAPSKRYPVLFHVYGGPQAPTVADRFQDGNYQWHQMLAQQGCFVVLCDNRASRGPGGGDSWGIHRNLGEVELRDLEDAVKWVHQQPWGDPERIGVWGWSYGGYFTAYALTHSKLFRAGIAGAPVTDWRNYDAVYTERYMDTPQNNPEGYKTSSAVEAAANLHGRLLLIHGEIDDNVHMANTLQMSYALQKANKPFDLMIYPKNRHGVVDAQQRRHMYQMMTDFIQNHLMK